jgi:hypothetical protein
MQQDLAAGCKVSSGDGGSDLVAQPSRARLSLDYEKP